jgi:N-acetylglucosaminyldiphosphoundecaprenol N-acetyl-beta-D-mannosaminyltransferase
MINIFGIDIDNDLDLDSFLRKINLFLESNEQRYIVTPNPEIILEARKDEELFYILNNASLSLADGSGLKLAAIMMCERLKRLSGSDVLAPLLSLAERRGRKVLIINREDGLSSKDDISSFIKNNYPNLKLFIQDANCQYVVPPRRHLIKEREENFFKKIINKIKSNFSFLNNDNILDFEADIMICNFGSPYQEKFVYHNIGKLPTVKVAISLGGSFDFLTGKIKRAPKFFRFLYLEWLWRLVKQPKRYKRIINAVFVFPFKFFYWRYISPFFYRKNVACLLYRKAENKGMALNNKKGDRELDSYEILLVERSEEKGHWQVPQGGLDGESIKVAGSREMYEELGIRNFSPKKIYENIFKYKTNRKGKYGFKGQKQSLMIAYFKGDDSDIDINFWDHSSFKWVSASDFVSSVHQVRKKASEIYLNKFKEYINYEKK